DRDDDMCFIGPQRNLGLKLPVVTPEMAHLHLSRCPLLRVLIAIFLSVIAQCHLSNPINLVSSPVVAILPDLKSFARNTCMGISLAKGEMPSHMLLNVRVRVGGNQDHRFWLVYRF